MIKIDYVLNEGQYQAIERTDFELKSDNIFYSHFQGDGIIVINDVDFSMNVNHECLLGFFFPELCWITKSLKNKDYQSHTYTDLHGNGHITFSIRKDHVLLEQPTKLEKKSELVNLNEFFDSCYGAACRLAEDVIHNVPKFREKRYKRWLLLHLTGNSELFESK